MSDGTPRRWVSTLVGDARQGIVGGGAFVVVGALVVALLAAGGGKVPAWTLGLPLLLFVPAVVVISALRCKLDGLAGELREARRGARESRKAEVQFRQQLDMAAIRDGPLDATTTGFMRRIQSLRDSVADPDPPGRYATDAEVSMMQSLIHDVRGTIGTSRALLTAEILWTGDDYEGHTPDNLRLTLGQLDALVETFGLERAEARAAASRPQGSGF
jgi:hypothetical protein